MYHVLSLDDCGQRRNCSRRCEASTASIVLHNVQSVDQRPQLPDSCCSTIPLLTLPAAPRARALSDREEHVAQFQGTHASPVCSTGVTRGIAGTALSYRMNSCAKP